MPEDAVAIRQLFAEYAHRTDEGRWTEWSELFAEDGILVIRGERYIGRAAIYRYVISCPAASGRSEGDPSPGRHLITNIEIVSGTSGPHVIMDFIHVLGTSAGMVIEICGQYLADLVWLNEGWRIAHLETTFLFDRGVLVSR